MTEKFSGVRHFLGKVRLHKNKNLAACDTLMERIKREFYILERLISFTNGQEFLRYTVMRREEIGKGMVYDNLWAISGVSYATLATM